MSEIVLTGPRAGTPIGFLAAIGAFRHASVMSSKLGDPRLAWTHRAGEWFATLAFDADLSSEAFLDALVKSVCETSSRPEFEWSEQIKKRDPADFRRAIEQNSSCSDWFAAFGSELALSKDGTLRSTDFDMTGGQQKFLLKLREASCALCGSPKETRRLLQEALFGPWEYKLATKGAEAENSHSMGLDPSTLLEGAFTAAEPAGIKDKRGIRGAIWLAFEALPLFPCVVVDGQLRTTGFSRSRSNDGRWKTYFEWGVWNVPLTLEAVTTLLLQPRCEWTPDRGVAQRFRSERVNLNKDYYSLAQAELMTGG
ncbi:MAG: hypothetical protein WA324_07080 [Bryobacteraceae bacterium]